MPKYIVNGKTYNIPDEKVEGFESKYPNATVEYHNDDKTYQIPLNKREGFLKQFPNASTTAQPIAEEQPQEPAQPTRPTRVEQPLEQPLTDSIRPMQQPRVVAPTSTPDNQEEYVEGFGAGFKQGWKGLKEGVKYFAGEAANLITGSSRDDAGALEHWLHLEQTGQDIQQPLLSRRERKHHEFMSSDGGDMIPMVVDENGNARRPTEEEKQEHRNALQINEYNKLIHDAIEEAGGDLTKAKQLLSSRAADKSWGDKMMESASEEMSQMKPTKGFGAWVGNLVPQMLPSAAAMALSFATKNPKYAKMVGNLGMGAMTASTAGQSMKEARDAGASTGQVWAVGIADGAIEYATEKLPFDRYTTRLFNGTKKKVGQELAEAVADNNSPARNELEKLLTEANKKLGGKLLNGKNVKDYAADILAEGASEFTAEALQTITPMIYENPEDYPTINEILQNGWEGAKAGLFMGSVLGGASKSIEHQQQRSRRQQQGFVDVAQVQVKDDGTAEVGEVVGVNSENGNLSMLIDGEVKEFAPESVMERHRFSFEEFDTGVMQMEENEAYDNGYSLEQPQEMNDAKNEYEYQQQNMRRIFGLAEGADVDAEIGNPIEKATTLKQAGVQTEEVQALLDYANAKATFEGMLQRQRDDIDSRITESNEMIDSRVSQNDGMIHPALMNVDDRRVYVVSGNIVMNEDNTMIDRENSDESIIVRDAETGELEFTEPAAILRVEPSIDPATEKEVLRQQITEEFAQQAANKIDGVLSFQPNEQYTLTDEQGTQHTATIVMDNGDNTVSLLWDNEAEPTIAEKEVVQQMHDATNLVRLQQFEQQRATERIALAEAEREAQRPVYNLNDHITVRTPDGVNVRGQITSNANEDGLYEIYTEIPISGKARVAQFTRDELDAMVVEHNGGTTEMVEQQPQVMQPTVEPVQQTLPIEQPAQVVEREQQQQEEEQEPVSALARIPVDAQGNQEFEKAPVQDSWAALVEMNEGDEAEALDTAQQMLSIAQKELDKALKQKPKGGTTVSEIQQNKAIQKAKVKHLQSKVSYWSGVAGFQAEQKRIAEALAKAERREKMRQARAAQEKVGRYSKEDAQLGDYLDFRDYVMRVIATGGVKFKWGDNSNGTKGLGSHLGLKGSRSEMSRRIWLLNNESGDYPEVAAEGLLQGYSEFVGGEGYAEDITGMTTMDAFNEVLDVVQSYDSPRSMFEAAQGRHTDIAEAQASEYADMEEYARAEAQATAMGMSVNDWLMYEEMMQEIVLPELDNITDNELLAIFADAYDAANTANYERGRENNQIQSGVSERERLAGGDADGNSVLPNQQPDNAGSGGQSNADGAHGNDVVGQPSVVDVPTPVVSATEPAVVDGTGLEQNNDEQRQADGSRVVESATPKMGGGIDRGDIRVLEEGLDATYGKYLSDSERTRRDKESERLVAVAKQNGLFIPLEQTKTLGTKYAKRTGESAVYVNEEAGKVFKVKNPYAKSAMKSGVQPEDAIFEHTIHNLLFPETAYTFEGISEDLGDVRFVLSQQLIRTTKQPTQQQVVDALASRGLVAEDKYSFGNDLVSVTDVEGDNVLLGENGELYFIDPIIKFKKPAREIVDALTTQSQPSISQQIEQAEQDTNIEPTEAQKEAGNYKKGHIKIDGFDITIETPKGVERSGVDEQGNKWSVKMNNTYGYIRGTEGVDGDHIDLFLSDNIDNWNGNVYVIDQVKPDGSFDEHKVMYGFNSIEEAQQAYLANYSIGWKGLGAITGTTKEEFQKWVASSHRKTKPFAEYKSVKTTEGQSAESKYGKYQQFHDEYIAGLNERKFIPNISQIRTNISQLKKKIKALESGMAMGVSSDEEFAKVQATIDDATDHLNAYKDILDTINRQMKEAERQAAIEEHQAQQKQDDNVPYSIEPTQYTTKKGKVLELQLVKFTGVLRGDVAKDAYTYAKTLKGWWDKNKGGFMMRSKEDAKKLTDYVSDAQSNEPVSFSDIKAVNDGNAVFAEPQPINDQQKEEQKPVWRYSVHIDDDGYTTLSREDVSGVYPIGDARFRQSTNTPEEMLDILRNPLNGMQEVLDAVGTTLENKITIRKYAEERNDIETLSKQYEEAYTEYFKYPVLGSGVNASTAPITVIERVRYYGSRLQDALKEQIKSEHKGLVERSNAVKKHLNDIQAEVKRKAIFSSAFKDLVSEDGKYSIRISKIDGAKRTVVADLNTENIGGEKLELSFEEMANILHHNNWVEAQPIQQEPAEPKTSNKLVTDERYAELKARMKAKLSGQMNMGIDPEILAIGTEMAVYHIEKGARKFIAYAKAMIEDMGDAIRPYLKSFYNGARELPEVDAAGYTAEMTPYDEVRTFDVANFDKRTPDAMAAAETVVKEQEVSKQAEQATQSIKNNRNNARKNRKKVVTSQQVMADLFGMPIADEQQTTTDYDTQRGSETENTPMGGEQRQDTTIAEPRGVDRGDDGDNVDDESRNGRVSRPSAGTKTVERKNTRNNRNARGTDYAPTTLKARYDANVAAIRLMHELQESGKSATKEQKETLRQYSGWGGLGTYFNNEFSAENKQLRELLSAEEYDAAVQSINSAYYTPATIIDTLWDIATKLGFEGGKILEGSAGIGNIIGSMPRTISEQSDIQAVEIDEVSGNILKLLYPDATVNVQGFEDTNIRNGSIDLAITNVPFVTGLRVFDKVDKDLSKKFGDIHDFCIAKNVRKLREGGLGIFITSNGTLDKSKKLREWLNAPNGGCADVIGAFRLNNDTFGGTTVTSDIIVVRKRVGGKVSPIAIDVQNASFVREGLYKTGESSWDSKSRRWIDEEKKPQMYYNDYFQQHPEFMAGEMLFAYEKGETFRPGSTGLYATEKTNQAKQLKAWVNTMQRLDNDRMDTPQEQTAESTTAKEGSLVVNSKGEICVSQQGEAVSIGINTDRVKGMPKADCLKAYNRIKNALDNVLRQQIDNQDDNLLQPALKELNAAYDDFYKKYGQLNKNRSIIFLRKDVDFPSVAAIEKYIEKKDIDGKVQISTSKTNVFKGRVIGFQAEPQPTTVKDGVIASLYKHGYIDIAYISDKLGLPADEVRETVLKEGLGFENPISGTIEVRYEYLSGNVREKIEQALSNNDDGRYDTNIKALEEVTPMDIPAHLIEFQIGSSWIEPTLYADFFEDKFGVQIEPPMLVNGVWIFQKEVGNLYNDKNRSSGVYSEVRKELTFGHELGIAAMNNTPKEIKKTVKHKDYAGNEYSETISDKEATSACAVRVAEIKDDFREWARAKMQSDEALAAHFTKVYNDKFNAIVPKRIDDMFLPEHFEGAANDVTLYTHQKQAVVRGTTEPLMLAHEVGTGKTFTLISTAMEMRRLGTAKKPMIVVQNATTGQFVNEAKRLYPNAKVLTIEPNERNPEGRRAFYGKIKYNDWDLIICPQSVFNEIPDNLDRQLAFIQERIDEKVYAMEAAKDVDSETSRKLRKDLEMEVEGLEEVMAEVANGGKFTMNIAPKKKKKDAKKDSAAKENAAVRAKKQLDRKTDDVQTFDELGVDALLVDEAHNYKRLGLTTNIKRTKGIDTQSSTQAASLFLKTRAVFDKCGWKNVVFATGTPISNTAAEIYTFMKYLIPKDVLMANDMYYFDDFVRNFGNISQSLEFTTSGKFKENTRFASYINLPELVRIWSSCCDTVLTKEVDYVNDKVPELEKNMHQDIFLPQTDGLVDIMRAVRATLAEYEKMSGKEKKANSHIPLTMFGIAKLAAIDPRLVNVDAQDEAGSKTNKAVEEVLRSLKETERYNGTVAIFSDNYKNTIDKVEVFNLFEDIKQKLIAHGIPADQIVVMSSNMSDTKKTKTFDAVNAGEVRVIFGTTASLGTGVNIQERLHTVIHMDAPNRPMDYTQRNGRILRQGNLHKEWGLPVRILRFGVEDSLDVTAYQRLKTKAAFIDSVMDGKGLLANNQDNRTLEEEEEGLFDNPVAALSGSQYALLKQQAEREARKYRNKKQQYEADQVYIHNTLRQHAGQTKKALADIEEHKARLEKIAKMFPDGKAKVITIQGKKCKTDAEIESALKELVNKPINEQVEAARKNPNYRNSVVPMTMSFDGMEVGISVSIKRDTTYDNKVKAMRIMMHKDITFSVPALDLMDVPVMGGYVRGVLDTLREEVITGKEDTDFIEALQRGIEKRAIEDNAMRQREGKPFPFDNELRDAEAKVAEYTDLMKKELAEKEAKYAERGSDAEIDLSEFSTDDIETEDEKEERQRHRLIDEDDNARERVSLSALHEFSRELGVSPRVVFDLNDIEDAKKRNSKGWYDTKTGEVVIVLPNATSDADIKETILHEVVAHKGLREVVGKDHFEEFLDKVFRGADKDTRAKIVALATKNGWNFRLATEEYMAGLAEQGFDSNGGFWHKVRKFFADMLHKAKIALGYKINDNDLRYMLWRSYKMQQSKGAMAVAEDVVMQRKLGVGNFRARQISEEEQIIAKAKKDGTYLKAPNGEPTNLTPKQWVQVRTKAFKEWFGDWEKAARIEKLRASTPINVAFNNQYELTRKSAKEWMQDNIKGEYVNKDTNEHIVVSNVGINEVTSHGSQSTEHLKSLSAIPQMIENSIFIDELPNNKDHNKYDSYRYYVCGLKIDGVDYTAKIVVGVKGDSKYYDHRLTEIEKGSLIDNLNGLSNSVVDNQDSLVSESKDTKLNEILQINSSKVVDANGEPKVVYNGSKVQHYNYDGRLRTKGQSATNSKVSFFTDNKTVAERYGKFVNEVFLNIRNPYEVDYNGAGWQGWSGAADGMQRASTDSYADLLANGSVNSTLERIIENYGRAEADHLASGKVHKEGVAPDGVIAYEVADPMRSTLYIVRNAEAKDISRNSVTPKGVETFTKLGKASLLFDSQIKSATDNIGSFSKDNDDIRFRRGSVAPPSSGVARHKYNKAVRTPNKRGSVKKFDNMAHRLQEAYQDSMLSLRELYGAILEETGNDLHDFEDAYKAENRMSSENKAQAEIYMRDFYKPLQDAVRGLIEEGAEYADIVRYMIAKHGLERNEVFYKRDAEKDGGTWDGEIKRDYSGLTELTQDPDNFTDLAQQMVDDFESAHDTSVFWDRVNAATKETLSKSYESGLMQKDTYEQVRDMFEYYIPLRGWDANVAANEYEYLSNNRLMLSPTLKTAQGRSSIADDPLATIGYMAESAIVQGNRNLMKQKFLNFVLNNPTSLATVSEQWYVKNAMGVWEPNNPVIPEDATADEVAAIVEQHEKDMEALGDNATKERTGLKLGLHATKWEGQEHTVRVSRNGKEYLIFINGNPIAAQAINGLTNPNSDPSSLQKAAMAVKNFMARAFTSQNPAFIFTNLSRDVIWAGTAVAIKEDKKYTAQYTKNVSGALLKGKMPQLIHKFQKGTLDTNVEIERYFDEFIRNGGETGFTQVNTVEDYKRDMERFIKEAQGGKVTMTKKAWRGLWNGIEFLNRSAEDTTRFAVYMTSRQMGRSVSQSVWDAKEITVNFNKKGRGTLGASVMNFAYIFFNATIQGLTNFGRLMAKHPVKTTLALSSFTAAGLIAPMLAVAMQAMLGDDDEERNGYWDLPEWVRRNNIVLFVPWSGNGFITIPLPHEVRPFYGMGELAFSCLMGKETVENALSKSVQGFASLLPLDYTGNAGNMAVNVTPTIAQPFAQLVVNKDYFGKPIYRKNDYNKLDPEWTKAYKGTNAFLVSGAKWLNEATGGDNVKSGLVDINPAVVEHIFESYLGGMGKTVNKTVKTFSMLWDKEAREWRNVPVVSSFYQEAEERTSGSQLNREYFDALDKAEETEHLFNGYKKQLKMGYMEYAEKLDSLISSPIFQQYKTVNGYKKAISKLNNALKMTTPEEREELETTIMELKAEMLDELKRLDESNK